MFLLVLAMQGCNPQNTAYTGRSVSEYFPLYGTVREATFKNDDASIGDKLIVEKLSEAELADGTDVSTFEYYLESSTAKELHGTVEWSSESSDGVRIHGYAEGSAGVTAFDPPISVSPTNDKWQTGDEPVCTETGGFTFRAELIGFEDCPVSWGPDWNDCMHLQVIGCSSGCDCEADESGYFFTGDYWQVATYGTAWKIDGDKAEEQKWNLLDVEIVQQ